MIRKISLVLLVLVLASIIVFSACATEQVASKPETKAPAATPAQSEQAPSKAETKAPAAVPAQSEKAPSKTETKAPAAAPAKATKLTMVQGGEPANLNWPEFGASLAQMPFSSVYEALTRRDPKTNEITPLLATRWEQVEPKRWRFYLRDGVKFHNGNAFTAEDVAATVKWTVGMKAVLLDFLPMADAEVKDRLVVDIITPSVDPQFPVRTPFLRVYPTAIARDKPDLATANAIGTGPYKLLEWRKGDRMVFAYFDGYWGKKPEITNVDLLFREEEAVRVAMLRTGEAQWAFPIGPDNAQKVPKLVRIPGLETWLLRLNTAIGKNLPLADKRLRMALNYAIDRNALVDHLYQKLASPSMGQRAVPAAFGWEPNLKDYPYDLEKAKALVKEAGAVGKTISWVSSSGLWPKDREFNQAVARMVEQTGLKVDLRVVEMKEFLDYDLVTPKERREIKSDVIAIASGTETLDIAQGRVYLAEGGATDAVEDPRVHALWREYDQATDIDGKRRKLQEISRYVQDEALIIWVLSPDFAWGVTRNLEWTPSPEGWSFVADMRFTE